jgi:hypothetical protein
MTPEFARRLFMRLSITPRPVETNLLIDLDGNRMNAADEVDFTVILLSLGMVHMHRVSLRFGFEIFVPSLTKAMNLVKPFVGDLSQRVFVSAGSMARELHELRMMHELEMNAIRVEIMTRENQRKADAAAEEKERKEKAAAEEKERKEKAAAEEKERKAEEKEREAAEAARREKRAQWLQEMEDIERVIQKNLGITTDKVSIMNSNDRARSAQLETDCARAVERMLVGGRVIATHLPFEHAHGGDFDGVIVGELDGRRVVVLLEVKMNVDECKQATLDRQVGAAAAAWEWYRSSPGEFLSSKLRKDHARVRRALSMDEHADRRVIVAVGGLKFARRLDWTVDHICVRLDHGESSRAWSAEVSHASADEA